MKTFVAFSGGKDSTALALMMPDAIPVFTDTGWEFDELYAHIDKFENVTGRDVVRIHSEETLPDYILRSKFMPGHRARFCTRMFKIDPMNDFLKDHAPCQLAIGLRADEGMRVGNQTELDGLNMVYPLRERGMGIYDVLRICLEHDLLPRYPVYMARGGCKGCYYKRRAEVEAMNHLIPETLDELRELETAVQDERGRFAVMFPNTGKSIQQIQAQPTLFSLDEVYRQASERDDYGGNCGLFCNR